MVLPADGGSVLRRNAVRFTGGLLAVIAIPRASLSAEVQ
jgi:hypothetical protein